MSVLGELAPRVPARWWQFEASSMGAEGCFLASATGAGAVVGFAFLRAGGDFLRDSGVGADGAAAISATTPSGATFELDESVALGGFRDVGAIATAGAGDPGIVEQLACLPSAVSATIASRHDLVAGRRLITSGDGGGDRSELGLVSLLRRGSSPAGAVHPGRSDGADLERPTHPASPARGGGVPSASSCRPRLTGVLR